MASGLSIPEVAPRYIAITGTDASGKDTYAHHLEELGFMHVSAGDVIRAEARAQGYHDPIPRPILSKVGDDMKARFGSAPIALGAIEQYSKQQGIFPVGLVISGFRRVAEVVAFKQHGATVAFFDADLELRFEWQSHREGRDKANTLEEFIEVGRKEYFGLTEAGKKGVYLQGVEQHADVKILNNGSKEELIQKTDALLGLESMPPRAL